MASQLREASRTGFLDPRVAVLCDAHVASITERYELGEELGQGRFSIVQTATNRLTGLRCAAKVVENETFDDEENVEAFEAEVRILRTLDHPHIVRLIEVVSSSSPPCTYARTPARLFAP